MRKSVPVSLTALPFLFCAAMAAEPLTNRQMDTVCAGTASAVAFASASAFGTFAAAVTVVHTEVISLPHSSVSFSSASSVSVAR